MAADAAIKTAENTTPIKQDKDKPKRTQGPRPCYVLLNQQLPEGVEMVGATRKAEEALEAIDKGEAEAYMRIMVK